MKIILYTALTAAFLWHFQTDSAKSLIFVVMLFGVMICDKLTDIQTAFDVLIGLELTKRQNGK